MNVQRLAIGLTITGLFLFSACSNAAAQPTPAPQPLVPAQTNTETAPTTAPKTEPTLAQPTTEPTQASPTETDATATPPPTDVPAAPPTALPTQPPSNTAGVPIGNINQVLDKACTAFKAQPNVVAHLVITGTDNGEFLIQITGTDHAHIFTTSTEDSKTETNEMVILPAKIYGKDSGTWQAMPVPTASAVKLSQSQVAGVRDLASLFICFDTKAKANLKAQLTDVRSKLALPEIVDGVPTLVYDVNVTVINGNNPGTGEAKYWLGATDSVPHKLWVQFTSAKQQGVINGTYSYAATDIQAPIP